MDLVRVRHPQTGQVSRIGRNQFDRHLAPLGFTLAGEEAGEDTPEHPDAPQEDAETPTAAEGDEEGDEEGDQDEEGDDLPKGGGDPLADVLGDATLADALRAAGLGTPETIRDAPDDALRAIKGIGAGRLKKLREYAAGAATTEEQQQ